jgi:hypothetical protein
MDGLRIVFFITRIEIFLSDDLNWRIKLEL